MLYKLNADVILTEIKKEHLENDFIFFDRRTAKMMSYRNKTNSYNEVTSVDPVVKSFSATMLSNPNFLFIDRIVKKDRVNTTYEPQHFTIEINHLKFLYYVADAQIPTDGLWVEISQLCDGNTHTIERSPANDAVGSWKDTNLIYRELSKDSSPIPQKDISGDKNNLRRVMAIMHTNHAGTTSCIFDDRILI
jgi:hypothetical protein